MQLQNRNRLIFIVLGFIGIASLTWYKIDQRLQRQANPLVDIEVHTAEIEPPTPASTPWVKLALTCADNPCSNEEVCVEDAHNFHCEQSKPWR